MGTKYEEAPDNLYEMYTKLRNQHFPDLANAKILLLVSNKKMASKGHIVLGKIVKPNDLARYLSQDVAPEDGYDFIILFDHKLIQHCEASDIERVFRHELRHIYFDSDTGKYHLIDHDFTDFYDEVELNKDDPTWVKRVAQIVLLIHLQEKDSQ